MKKYTRYIDRVTVKGSIRPIGLYTVDMDVEHISVKKEIDPNFSKYDIVKSSFLFYLLYLKIWLNCLINSKNYCCLSAWNQSSQERRNERLHGERTFWNRTMECGCLY